jgi:hypothetical protein
MSTIEEAKLLVERRGLVEANRRAKSWSSTVGERWQRIKYIDRVLSVIANVEKTVKAEAKRQLELSKECRMPFRLVTSVEQTRSEIQAISDAWGMQVMHPGLKQPDADSILDEVHPQLGTTLRQNLKYDLANRPV